MKDSFLTRTAVVWGLAAVLACMASIASATAMPKIVSHRGESARAPENSMAAFRLAVESGVWGMECDVYATSDGVPVVMHDATTGRTAGSATNLTLTASTWDDLKDVKVSAFTAYGTNWAVSAYADETLPAFADYLALLRDSSVTAVVELKSSANSLVDRVVAAVQAETAATSDRVVFISFDSSLVQAVRTALPDYPAWLLLSSTTGSADILSKLAACNATGVDISSSANFDADVVAAVKAAGYDFHVWTVDNTDRAAELARMGVDGITTDYGARMLADLPARIAALDDLDPIVDPSRPLGLHVYDVGDYVTNGLVAMYDGIRNAGKALPHDPAATKWTDLVDESRTASFKKTTINANTGFTPANDGEWTKDGYFFSGSVYAEMDSALALGSQFTIQLATTCDYLAQPAYHYMNVFAAPNDFCVFISNINSANRSRAIQWKYEPYKASGSSTPSRPSFSWNGQYLTVMVGEDNFLRLFEGGTLPGASVTPAVSMNATAAKWTWAGSSYGPADRTSVGTWHCVRLYNRALTDAEIRQNRRVDDFRFRGDANVVVCSTVPGAEATEACGNYDVNGSHTFTASGVQTVDGVDYAPAGYQLEIWDATHKVWNKSTESTATSYCYTNCVAQPRARLTWIWRPVRGLVKYDASAYAQHGLLLNFDGIENAGRGQPHATNATTWVNLGAAPVSATLGTLPIGGAGGWGRHGFDFGGGQYFALTQVLDLGDAFMVQVATDFESRRQQAWLGDPDATDKARYPTLFGSNQDVVNLYTGASDNNMNFKCDAIVGGNWEAGRSRYNNWPGRYLNAFVDFDSTTLRIDATMPTSWTRGTSYSKPVGRRSYFIGGVPMGSSDVDRVRRCLVGTIYSVRAYDRVLTTYELQRNRDIDGIRFFGNVPTAVVSNGVWVCSNVEGLAGNEGNAFYEVLGDAHAFTCSADDVTLNGYTYEFAGYSLESYNATTKQWELVATSADAGFTLTPANGQSHRRLIWNWRMKRGLRTVGDYTVADYVQAGLVAHYDGIQNLGVDNRHDATTRNWRDLSGRDNTATPSSNASPTWGTDGYVFAGNNYYRMDLDVTLGDVFTVQSAVDFDCSKQIKPYPNIVAVKSDYGIFTRNTGNTLEWKADEWSGGDWTSRSTQANWAGDYLTAIMTMDKQYLFSGTAYANAAARPSVVSMPGYRWSIGTAWAGANDRYMVGTVKSVRFYNRALTPEELVWNRKVDDARFRGTIATNVVVASNKPDAQGVEANGAYEVAGAWTFTAVPVEGANGKTLTPVGYALETWENGAWGARSTYVGTSFEYDTATAAAPVRLTWKFSTLSGTTVIFR